MEKCTNGGYRIQLNKSVSTAFCDYLSTEYTIGSDSTKLTIHESNTM